MNCGSIQRSCRISSARWRNSAKPSRRILPSTANSWISSAASSSTASPASPPDPSKIRKGASGLRRRPSCFSRNLSQPSRPSSPHPTAQEHLLPVKPKSWETYRVPPGKKVRLAKVPADATDLCDDKSTARKRLKHLRKQINALAETLAIENQRSLLVILQGMDASGKDGAVKKVFTGVNPQHCRVVSFKQPDREEREHDYLWRIYRALPAKGELGIFNRSQYEDVVTLHARGILTRKQAHLRLRQICDVERTWVENGIVLRKLFLHISRDEQTRRFQARLDTPEKHWKVQQSDFEDRRRWPAFQSAYEHILARTSTKEAPWYILPADHKWYRDLAVAEIVLSALHSMRPRIPMSRLDRTRLKL
ncbi:polyphosphate kinase 2 family protein [Acidobacteria bacterium AB60]|nr:polyphosphate kinase 2 family protein [Acidobacteria bacterium AB60]